MRSDGRALQVINQVVTSLSNKQALPQAPNGWQDIVISWERDAAIYGMQRSFTSQIQFVRDGAKIAKQVFYGENIDSQVYLLIQKLNLAITNTTFQWVYEYFYRGEVDWSTFEDDDPQVGASIMEGGISKLYNAYKDTEFSIPFDEDARNIRMDGISFDEKANYEIIDLESPRGEVSNVAPIAFLNNESNNPFIAFFTQTYQDSTDGGADFFKNNQNYFLHFSAQQAIKVTGNLIVDLKDGNGVIVSIINQNSDSLFTSGLIDGSGVKTIPLDCTITGNIDDSLFLVCNRNSEPSINYQQSPVTISFTFKYPESIIRAYDPWTFYKKLVQKVTGFEENAGGEILKTCPYYITCGDAIRRIDGAAIKTSLTNFLKAYDVYLKAGMGIEQGKLVFEDRTHFFDASNPISLSAAKQCKITEAKDFLGTSIKIGHAEQTINDVNGKFDFNGYQVYTTPQTRVSKEIDLQSPYKAGPYEIELTRINLDGKTTTDANNDNDVFVIDVNIASAVPSVVATVSFQAGTNIMSTPLGIDFITGQRIRITGSASNDNDYVVQGVLNLLGIAQLIFLDKGLVDESDVSVEIDWLSGLVYDLDRSIIPDDPTFDTDGNVITGFPDKNSIFNIRLSPRRLLAVHGPWIRSWLYNYEPGSLVFQTPNRYAEFTTGGIKEDSDFPIADLGNRMFLPFLFDFEDEVPIELVQLMEENPNRCFTFDWNGQTYKGFNMQAHQAANTEASQSFLLLATPDTDPKTLIY